VLKNFILIQNSAKMGNFQPLISNFWRKIAGHIKSFLLGKNWDGAIIRCHDSSENSTSVQIRVFNLELLYSYLRWNTMNILAPAVHLHCTYNNTVSVTNISFVPRVKTMTRKKTQ